MNWTKVIGQLNTLLSYAVTKRFSAKILGGLALGALLMNASVLAPSASADVPSRPVTSAERLEIQGEMEDGEPAYHVGKPFTTG